MDAVNVTMLAVDRASGTGAVRPGFLVKASVGLALLLTGACLALSPLTEKASAKPLEMGIAHPGLPTDQLDLWLPRAADPVLGAGAGTFHIYVVWRHIAPTSPTQEFEATNPGDPQYRFTRLDREVRAASAAGMRPMMSVFSAPDFAEGTDRPASAAPGTWKPNPQDYADFATALADRYDGDFTPSGEDSPLPEVDLFEVWNEPNLATFLTPQVKGKTLVGADRYRALANAFYGAIRNLRPDAQVAVGATAPYGSYFGSKAKIYIPPLRFLRRTLCLKPIGKRGKLAKACGGTVAFDALSHHPISSQRGRFTTPTRKPRNPDDLNAANFGKLSALLRSAERLGRVVPSGAGGRELWATEIWEFSDPPDPKCGVPLAKQARNIQQSLYLIASQGASSIHYYMIRDTLPERNCQWTGSGLYSGDAEPKPALTAFRFPFLTVRNGKVVSAWGRAPSGGRLVIERFKGGWRQVASVDVAAGNTFTVRLGKLPGPGRYRATVGDQTSLIWKQSAGRW